jgi:hypothetical protein
MNTTLSTKCWKSLQTVVLVLACLPAILFSQAKYRTFNQFDLAAKKINEGKVLGNITTFTFFNDSLAIPVNSLHVRFNSELRGIVDSGGFTTIQSRHEKKILDFTGQSIAPGASVTISIAFEKKGHGTKANFWWWDTNGTIVGARRSELAGIRDSIIQKQPNGGNVREYIYKRVVRRSDGLLVGLPNSVHLGYIKYSEGDRKFFPHTDSARCFDYYFDESARRPFTKRLKNPHVKKHNNNLLGELHALKLAILANDSSVTEPLDPLATALGDLLYNDPSNTSDPFNGLTVRGIVHLTDSALTYCANFTSSFYFLLDSGVSRINRAFDGPYIAESFHPLVLAGTHALTDVPFLHPNPSIAVTTRPFLTHIAGNELPEEFSLRQNFPNPFNPSTTIEFVLSQPSTVTLTVFNILGQEVARLVNAENMEDGVQTIEFDATHLTSGVYYYRLTAQSLEDQTNHFESMKSMLLIK